MSVVREPQGILGAEPLTRGYSSVGRAIGSQSIGQGFESPYLHKKASDMRRWPFCGDGFIRGAAPNVPLRLMSLASSLCSDRDRRFAWRLMHLLNHWVMMQKVVGKRHQ